MENQVPNITTGECARCLAILKAVTQPIVAADIAARMYLAGSRETQRRHVRALVKELRDGGCKVIATLQGGYWLTDDEAMWRDYLDGHAIDAKRILGNVSMQKKMLADTKGQGLLFVQKVHHGSAVQTIY